jgi:hypothetical protein
MAGRIILGIANPALNANGVVDTGATETFYQNLTTTLQTIYADHALLTPLPNPLPCDAAGRFPMVWAADLTLFSVKWTPTGASPITYDYIQPQDPASVAGQVLGTATNDNAAAGYVGEYIEATNSSGTSVTTNVATNLATLSLTAGDWDVDGIVCLVAAGPSSISQALGWSSVSSATQPAVYKLASSPIPFNQPNGATVPISLPIPTLRYSLGATTTIYLTALGVFTAGCTGTGFIRARRVR